MTIKTRKRSALLATGRTEMKTGSSRKARMPETSTKSAILAAAAECFEQYGPVKTTMEDIAAAADVDRKTIYRLFANRTELLEAVAVHRLDRMVELVRAALRKCETLEQSLITGSLEIIRLARKDRVFMAIVADTSDGGIEHYLIAPSSPVFNHAEHMWTEAFTRARERGEWRDEVPDVKAKTWLRAVHLVLLLRDDLDTEGQIDLLKTFVLPGLLKRLPAA